jgi:hypothetical protein
VGIEPTTFPLPRERSTTELHRQELGGAGFAPAKAKMPSGLQPDPFDYLGTHPSRSPSQRFRAGARLRLAPHRGGTSGFSPPWRFAVTPLPKNQFAI